jgi:hypothetical protein
MAKVFWLLPRKDGKKFDMVLLGAPAPAPTALSLVHRAANRDLLRQISTWNSIFEPFEQSGHQENFVLIFLK